MGDNSNADRSLLESTLNSLSIGVILLDNSLVVIFNNKFTPHFEEGSLVGTKITEVLTGLEASHFEDSKASIIVSLIKDSSIVLSAEISELHSGSELLYVIQLWPFSVEDESSSIALYEGSLAAALAGAHGAVWHWDIHTNTVRLYSYFTENFSNQFNKKSLSLADFLRIIHPDDLPLVKEAMNKCVLGQRQALQLDFRIQVKDDQWRWVRASGQITSYADDADDDADDADDANHLVGLIGLLVDINNLKQSETEYNLLAKHLDRIINTAPSLIITTDKHMRITTCNHAVLDATGYTENELIGLPLYKLYEHGQKSKSEINALFRQLSKTGVLKDVDRILRRKDGSSLPVMATYVTFSDEDGETQGTLVSMIDISEREKTLESLRESQEALRFERDRFRTYFDLSQVIIVALDATGKIVMINRVGIDLLGFPEDELIGRYWFDFVPEREREVVRQRFAKLIKGTLEAVDGVLRPIISINGEERIIKWKTRPIYNSDGAIVGSLSSGVDVTEQLKAETLLKRERASFRVVAEAAVEVPDTTTVTKKILEGLSSALGFSSGVIGLYDPKQNALVRTATFGIDPEGFQSVIPLTLETSRKFIVAYAARNRKPIICSNIQQCGTFQSSFETINMLGVHAAVVLPILDQEGFLLGIISFTSEKIIPRLEEDAPFFETLTEMIATVLERVRSLEALQRSEQRFRELVLNSPEGIGVTNSEGLFVIVNDAFARILGFTPAEMVGTSIWDYVASDDKIILGSETQKQMEGQSSKYLLKMCHKDGSQRTVSISAVPTRNQSGQIDGTFAVIVDVTDQIRAELELQESEKRYRFLVRSITDVILIVDHDGNITEMYSRGYILPSHDGPIKASLTEMFSSQAIETLHTIIHTVHITHTAVSKEFILPIENDLRWIIVMGSPHEDAEHIVLVLRDMTDLRKTEAQMRAADRGASLYLDLLGHDIRNYLQAILINVEMLEELSNDPRISTVVESISDVISKSTELIASVQSDTPFLKTPLREIEINPILVECMEKIAFANPKVTIESHVLVPHARVLADIFIKTAFMNVLDNAVHHNPSENPRIWVSLRELRDGFQVEISDNGPGIDDDHKRILFDPSSRLSGIGIHQAVQIIEKYGGHMEILDRVQDDYTKGSTFRIWLPKIGSGR